MSKISLSVKYRPQKFEDVCGQNITTTILTKIIESKTFKNVFIFAGASGCGKTTCARIFANEINKGIGSPIEIDAASNNGVDNVREIIESANQRSLTGEYKVYIIDEAHAITSAGWQAFLKGIEEPPKYTIFIFCTTEPNKIPVTILNRAQRYNFTPIDTALICERLKYICQQEQFTNYAEACDFIAKISFGGMREAITLLDKCADYSTELSIQNIKNVLGEFDFETLVYLTTYLIHKREPEIIQLIEYLFRAGKDLRVFIDNYLSFLVELIKYAIFKDISLTNIPAYLETVDNPYINIKQVINFDGNLDWLNRAVEKINDLKVLIKTDTNYKTTIIIKLISLIRE